MKTVHSAGRLGFISVLIIVIAFSVCASAFAGGLTKIADGIYSYVDVKNPSPATSFGANAGIIIGKDGVVVVDSLTSAKEAQRFIKDIRSITDKPIKYVVNTHHHLDHSLGNSEFVKLGAAVIGQENCRTEAQKDADTILKRALNYGFTPEALEGTTVVLPSLTFKDKMTIELGDRIVELIYPGPSHTAGSSFILIPDVKVLFAGDTLFTNFHPNIRDADVDGWIKSLDRIAALDVQKIIPGHGPTVDRTAVTAHRDMLLAVRDRVSKLIEQGRTQEEAVAAKPAADYVAKVSQPGANPGAVEDRFIGQVYAELKAAR